MLGTVVFFRDPARGWTVGQVCGVDGDDVTCRSTDGNIVDVPSGDVAVARQDCLDEAPPDLSHITALHPGTLIRALRKRFELGSPFAAIGPYVALFLNARASALDVQTLRRQCRDAEAHNHPVLYPRPRRPLDEPHNKGLAEPLGWWTTGKQVFRTAMLKGKATVVSLGESGADTWLHRLCAHAMRRKEEAAVAAEFEVGGGLRDTVSGYHFFHDDLEYQTGIDPFGCPSQRLETAIAKMGSGRWVTGTTSVPPAHPDALAVPRCSHCDANANIPSASGWSSLDPSCTHVHHLQASLLSDVHAVCDAFLTRSSPCTPHVYRPSHIRHTRLFFSQDGFVTGFDLAVHWTARDTGGTSRPSIFQLLAHSGQPALHERLFGAAPCGGWPAAHDFIACGGAFGEVQGLLQRSFRLSPKDMDALWGMLAGLMLLQGVRYDEAHGKADLVCGDFDRVGQLLAVPTARLRHALLGVQQRSGHVTDLHRRREMFEARRDALGEALYEGVVSWLVRHMNSVTKCPAARKKPSTRRIVVHSFNVPDWQRGSDGRPCSLSDLCHNICIDAVWGLYDTTVFDATLHAAEREGCSVDPLLDQLKARPVLEKLNPILQTLSHLDTGCAGEEVHTCAHISGDTVEYVLKPSAAPPLQDVYGLGVRETSTASLVRQVLPQCRKTTHAAASISIMSDILAAIKASSDTNSAPTDSSCVHWFITIDPSVDDIATGRRVPFHHLAVEASLYTARVVETSLLCKIGYATYMPLGDFVDRYLPIVFPTQPRDVGVYTIAKMIAETVFGRNSGGWDDMVDGVALTTRPPAPPPLHLGREKVLLTVGGLKRLEGIKWFTASKLAVLVQMFARTCISRLPVRRVQCVTTIQRFARLRLSAGLVWRMRTAKAVATIVGEVHDAAQRRRQWRAATGLSGSRAPYAMLRAMHAHHAVQQDNFQAYAIEQHCRWGLEQAELLLASFASAKRRLFSHVIEVGLRDCVAEEATCRAYLECHADVHRQSLHAHLKPVVCFYREAHERRGIEEWQIAEAAATARYYTEAIEVCRRKQLQRVYERARCDAHEGSARRIVAHSQRRCWDLLVKDMTLQLMQMGAFNGRGAEVYGRDFDVDFEPLRRQIIMQQERAVRGDIAALCVEAEEGVHRMHLRRQVGTWYLSLRDHPYTEVPARLHLRRGEVAARVQLTLQFTVADEVQQRCALMQCEAEARARWSEAEWLQQCEVKSRALIAHQYASLLTHATDMQPSLSVSPEEAVGRMAVEANEHLQRVEFTQRAAGTIEEQRSREGLAATHMRTMVMLHRFSKELEFLIGERASVHSQLARRPPIVKRSFDPADFVVPMAPQIAVLRQLPEQRSGFSHQDVAPREPSLPVETAASDTHGRRPPSVSIDSASRKQSSSPGTMSAEHVPVQRRTVTPSPSSSCRYPSASDDSGGCVARLADNDAPSLLVHEQRKRHTTFHRRAGSLRDPSERATATPPDRLPSVHEVPPQPQRPLPPQSRHPSLPATPLLGDGGVRTSPRTLQAAKGEEPYRPLAQANIHHYQGRRDVMGGSPASPAHALASRSESRAASVAHSMRQETPQPQPHRPSEEPQQPQAGLRAGKSPPYRPVYADAHVSHGRTPRGCGSPEDGWGQSVHHQSVRRVECVPAAHAAEGGLRGVCASSNASLPRAASRERRLPAADPQHTHAPRGPLTTYSLADIFHQFG